MNLLNEASKFPFFSVRKYGMPISEKSTNVMRMYNVHLEGRTWRSL